MKIWRNKQRTYGSTILLEAIPEDCTYYLGPLLDNQSDHFQGTSRCIGSNFRPWSLHGHPFASQLGLRNSQRADCGRLTAGKSYGLAAKGKKQQFGHRTAATALRSEIPKSCSITAYPGIRTPRRELPLTTNVWPYWKRKEKKKNMNTRKDQISNQAKYECKE